MCDGRGRDGGGARCVWEEVNGREGEGDEEGEGCEFKVKWVMGSDGECKKGKKGQGKEK